MIQAAFLLQDHRRFSPAAARGQRGRLCCVSKSEIYFVRSSRSLGTGVIVLHGFTTLSAKDLEEIYRLAL